MKALQVSEFGDPDVLTVADVPEPTPGAGEVVVALSLSDVLLVDTLMRRGGESVRRRGLVPPFVPGTGGVGTVVSVGPDVDSSWVGRRVVAHASGSYAEQVVAPVTHIEPVPDGLDDATAAALIHDGATSTEMHRRGAPQAGEWVLVTAAAGGAGSLLVQHAVAAGARVIAAASSADKRELAKSLGADVTVDYTVPGWDEQVRRASGGGVALAYDGAGGELGAAALAAVADGGRLVSYGTANGMASLDIDQANRRGVEVVTPLLEPYPDKALWGMMGPALALGARGVLRPVIAATYPLEQAEQAHRDLEARRVLGKTLLAINPGPSADPAGELRSLGCASPTAPS